MSDQSRELIVIVSGSRYDGMRRSARGLSDSLSGSYEILYVDPPVSPITHLRTRDRPRVPPSYRLERVGDHVSLVKPLVLPGKDRPAVRTTTRRIMQRQVASGIRSLGARPLAVIQQSPHHSILGTLGERVSIYHASDDFTAGAALLGVDGGYLARREEATASRAGAVLAVSHGLVTKWSILHERVVYFPNGVDTEAFSGQATPAQDVNLAHPIAGVVGTMSERIDLALLASLSEKGVSLLLVGPRSFRHDASDFEALVKRPNVAWIGEVPFEALPSYYEHIDVGLVPYTMSVFNKQSSPLKALEYLAAGKPVISVDLPAVRAIDTDEIVIAANRHEFVEHTLLLGLNATTPELVASRRATAQEHSWSARARQLADLIEDLATSLR